MFKNISLFALAFAVVGLTGCETEETTTIEETPDATVVTPVVPADEMMEDAGAAMEEGAADMEAAGEEMMEETDAAVEEMEAEVEGE